MSAAVRKKVQRKAVETPMKQAAYRLPIALLDRVDGWARGMETSAPGLQLSQTDAVRMLLERALAREPS